MSRIRLNALISVMTVFLLLGAPVTDFTPVFADENSVLVVEDRKDPWEGFNRSIHRFNMKVDEKVLRPVAQRYVKHVPPKVRKGVRNFFNNLREPTTIVNDLLQGKPAQAGSDSLRFLINSTFGVLGVFDVATHLNLPRNREDFGQTLGRWGVPSGPYLVLPFLGPSNLRDATGLIPQYAYTDMTAGIEDEAVMWSLTATRVIDTRAGLLSADKVLEEQLDPYVFLRETYAQRRLNDIYDGNPPEAEDELLDEILEETN